MKKTNIGLVDYVTIALNQEWGYVWGTFGQKLTEPLLQQKIKQYPAHVGNHQVFIRRNWMGKHVADCVGLIKAYMWLDGDKIRYNPSTDVNANMMYQRAKEKGPISTIPEIPGICVWKQGHIGVYVGNGQVIEARGTRTGVIKSPLRGAGAVAWTHWLKCPYIEYIGNHINLNLLGRTIKAKGEFKVDTNYIAVKIKGKEELIPIRDYLEPLGLDISWEGTTKTVVVK